MKSRRVFRADRPLDDAGERRGDIVAGDGRAEDQVDVEGVKPRVLNRRPGGPLGHDVGRLRGDPPLLHPGALDNPFVRSIDDPGEILVGHDGRRQVFAGS